MRIRIFRHRGFVPVFLSLLIYFLSTNAQGSTYNFPPVNQYGINLTAESAVT